VLRSAHNTYLNASPDKKIGLAPHTQEWEAWTITPHPSAPGKFALRSHLNTYLCADANRTSLHLAERAAEWEAWEITNAQ
jgi:hypothetical protein